MGCVSRFGEVAQDRGGTAPVDILVVRLAALAGERHGFDSTTILRDALVQNMHKQPLPDRPAESAAGRAEK